MGYEPAGVKGIRIKERDLSSTDIVCYTVAGAFGGRDPKKITLILQNERTGNTFYAKHVLRKGEKAKSVHAVRNGGRDYNLAVAAGDARAANRAIRRAQAGHHFGLTKAAGTSTFIDLNVIDHKLMLHHMAKSLADKNDRIPVGGGNVDVEINFDTSCVVDYPGSRGHVDWIIVGLSKTADDGHRITFDVNHCANNSEQYL